MKYFLLGAFSSALLLFGIALVYGYSGSLRYSEIAEATQVPGGLDSLLLVGVGADPVRPAVQGRRGAVPHVDARRLPGRPDPDHRLHGGVHQGRRVRRAAADRLHDAARASRGTSASLLWTVAILTMVVGTVAALVQTDMKRVLGVLLDRARRVHPHRHHRAERGRHRRGAVLPAGLRGRDGRRVRHRLAGAGARGRATTDGSSPILGEATHLSQWAGLGRTHPLLALTFGAVPALVRGHPADRRLRREVLGVLRGGRGRRVAARRSSACWRRRSAVFFYVRIIVLMFFTEPAGRRRGAHRGRRRWRRRRRASPWPVTRRWPSRRSRWSRRARPSRRP